MRPAAPAKAQELADMVSRLTQLTDLHQSEACRVKMLVGPAIHTTCRCDGVVSSRFQRPGDFDVVPSGYSATWIHASPTIALFVNVTPALVSTAAEGMGLNPACVAYCRSSRLQY